MKTNTSFHSLCMASKTFTSLKARCISVSNLKHEVIAERWAALIKERPDSSMAVKEWCQERNFQGSQATPFVELPAICRKQELQLGRLLLRF